MIIKFLYVTWHNKGKKREKNKTYQMKVREEINQPVAVTFKLRLSLLELAPHFLHKKGRNWEKLFKYLEIY